MKKVIPVIKIAPITKRAKTHTTKLNEKVLGTVENAIGFLAEVANVFLFVAYFGYRI